MTFENIVTRGGIAHDEQFLLLPQCFSIQFNMHTFTYGEFRYNWVDFFRVVRLVVYGKWLKTYKGIHSSLRFFLSLLAALCFSSTRFFSSPARSKSRNIIIDIFVLLTHTHGLDKLLSSSSSFFRFDWNTCPTH